MTTSSGDFAKAVSVGRPPNIRQLFPNSNALLISGKFIDLAMLEKKNAICMAANGRNAFVIRGALKAAQRANAALIIEIARSEGGADAYCATNYWNMARMVDAVCNELGITIPVAIHADHYGIKSQDDIQAAKIEIPTMFEAGITSIAIDASHLPDDQNLLANLELRPFVPEWSGLETEIGEIKGKLGLSTRSEALFLIKGLNAHGIFPNWIALNNGTVHGIEASGQGIQVDLTREIHDALSDYHVSGAQHGTSGNSSQRLRDIATRTRTTKANVATALQMISESRSMMTVMPLWTKTAILLKSGIRASPRRCGQRWLPMPMTRVGRAATIKSSICPLKTSCSDSLGKSGKECKRGWNHLFTTCSSTYSMPRTPPTWPSRRF
jgi:fructose/tagatose bisphosphate aldolase